MPTVNRRDIRKQMLDLDITDGLYGTATTGATGALTDTTLLAVGGNASSRYGNWFLYRPAAANASDVYRRVTAAGYAPTTGVLTHGGGNWTVAPLASGDSGYYELHQFDPRDVNAAIVRALTKRCFTLERDTFTANGQSRYDVTAAPISLTSITTVQDQVLEFSRISGTDPNARISPWATAGRTWWPEGDGATQYVRFDPPPSGEIQVTWKKPYATLTDETTTTTCPVDYVAWAAWFELFDVLAARSVGRSEASSQYELLRQKAFDRYWVENHKVLDRFASMFQFSPPRGRTRTSGPRMGRSSDLLYGAGGQTITGT